MWPAHTSPRSTDSEHGTRACCFLPLFLSQCAARASSLHPHRLFKWRTSRRRGTPVPATSTTPFHQRRFGQNDNRLEQSPVILILIWVQHFSCSRISHFPSVLSFNRVPVFLRPTLLSLRGTPVCPLRPLGVPRLG